MAWALAPLFVMTFVAVFSWTPVPTSGSSTITVTISPNYSSVRLRHTLQFTAKVTGTSNMAVIWQVNNATGGNSATGTISSSGLYSAPSVLPTPPAVTVTAISQASLSTSATAPLTLVRRAASGTTHYVSTSGKDSNPGTFSSPWRTIQHAANSVKAGDTVYVLGGVYQEAVIIPVSGSASAGFITFSNYPGQTATLDGTGLSIPNGQWGLVTIQNQSYIIINGLEIRNYKTSSAANVPIGVYILGAGSEIQILNNHIHDIATTATTCKANAFGLTAYGTQAPASINNLVISGNELDHMTTGCSETVSVNGNVEIFSITSNLVHDNNNIGIDVIGYESSAPKGAICGTVLCDRARNGEIRGNTIYNITSNHNPAYGPTSFAASGIYVDGGTQIIIEQNLVHNTDIGIELASENPGSETPGLEKTDFVITRNNVIYKSNSVGISIGGYDAMRGGTDHCSIVNNTLFWNDTANTGLGEFQIQYYATNNIVENNIFYATAQGLFSNSYTTSEPNPAKVDYNLYYSFVGSTHARWNWLAKMYTGYSTYLTKTGNDSHSPPFSNPLFNRTSTRTSTPPNLHVKPWSPAINAGTNLGTSVVGAVDFTGNPRAPSGAVNLGAYEQ